METDSPPRLKTRTGHRSVPARGDVSQIAHTRAPHPRPANHGAAELHIVGGRGSESAHPRMLSLDAHGRILDWISWQDAVCLYAREAVAWTLGDPCLTIHGGYNRLRGEQSTLDLHPIIAARGHARGHALDPTPALTNAALFARDAYLCMYCGNDFPRQHLTRDHVLPVSRGGRDVWENVVCACYHCNSRKGGRTPQQAGMPLLAVPFRPSWVEHLILSNRHILADQMAFLTSHLPKRRRAQA